MRVWVGGLRASGSRTFWHVREKLRAWSLQSPRAVASGGGIRTGDGGDGGDGGGD